jgi:2-keto-4-pentenoate hydratase/2-oxohepta-3-ene-1,7-dioic acid hydratase in catechol pathway
MKLALAEVPAPYLLEPRVMAQGAGGGWTPLAAAIQEAGLVDGPPSGDIAAALTYLSELKPTPRRRIERVLEAKPTGRQPERLLKPVGPDRKLLLTEGRVALSRSNDQKPAKSPVGFSMFESAFADPGATLRLPDAGAHYDAEAVLVATMGRGFHRGTDTSAARSVVGFTLMCQITHRDLFDEEAVTRNNLMAKNCDRLSPLGPAIWIAEPRALDPATVVTMSINGQERQRFAVADLAHSVSRAVRAWGRCVLDPGDAVGLGAAICWAKPGNAVDSPIPVKSGDAIEVACEPIGTLTARIG